MKPFLIAAVSGLAVSAAAAAGEEPVRQLSTVAIPFFRSRVPLFRHGYLVLWPPGGPNGVPAANVSDGFDAYGPDGKLAYKKTIEVPGGSQSVVYDVDFDADGNAAVTASALGGPSQFLHIIMLLDRNGNQTGLIDTGRYFSAKIAIAPDRSIWALGWQQDADRTRYPDRNDYMIVRHFSAEGKEVGAYLPRSSFPAGLEPGYQGEPTRITVTEDRLGILAVSGRTGANAEWVEMDLNGNVTERSRLDDVRHGASEVAFTAGSCLFERGNEILHSGPFVAHVEARPDAERLAQGSRRPQAGLHAIS
jgi:hypothetical protein